MTRVDRYGALALLGVSLILNLGLAQSLRGEKAESERLREGLLRMKAATRLAVGERVPPIYGEDAHGSLFQLHYEKIGRPTLLYVFSPSCRWCQRNIENFHTLGQKLAKSHRVVGVSLSEIPLSKRREETEKLGFPVVFNPSPESLEAYKLGGTPQTLLLSPDGVVLKNWTGAYANGLAEEIEKSLGVELPGLTDV